MNLPFSSLFVSSIFSITVAIPLAAFLAIASPQAPAIANIVIGSKNSVSTAIDSHPIPTKPDYQFLTKALQKHFGSNYYQTQLRTYFSLENDGETSSAILHSNTITGKSDQFRTELMLWRNGNLGNSYLLVSDGETTSILDRDRNQYWVMSTEEFYDLDVGFLNKITLPNMLLLMRDDLGYTPAEMQTISTEVVKAKLFNNPSHAYSDITFGEQILGNQTSKTITVHCNPGNPDGLKFTFQFAPQTADLLAILTTATAPETSLKMSETIDSRVALSQVTADTFTFAPPANSQPSLDPLALNIW